MQDGLDRGPLPRALSSLSRSPNSLALLSRLVDSNAFETFSLNRFHLICSACSLALSCSFQPARSISLGLSSAFATPPHSDSERKAANLASYQGPEHRAGRLDVLPLVLRARPRIRRRAAVPGRALRKRHRRWALEDDAGSAAQASLPKSVRTSHREADSARSPSRLVAAPLYTHTHRVSPHSIVPSMLCAGKRKEFTHAGGHTGSLFTFANTQL